MECFTAVISGAFTIIGGILGYFLKEHAQKKLYSEIDKKNAYEELINVASSMIEPPGHAKDVYRATTWIPTENGRAMGCGHDANFRLAVSVGRYISSFGENESAEIKNLAVQFIDSEDDKHRAAIVFKILETLNCHAGKFLEKRIHQSRQQESK